MPAARLARCAVGQAFGEYRRFLKKRNDAADRGGCANARVESRQARAHPKYSRCRRQSETTACKRRETKRLRRSFSVASDSALRKSARDRSCCRQKSVARLRFVLD